jgi:hypothetical protein
MGRRLILRIFPVLGAAILLLAGGCNLFEDIPLRKTVEGLAERDWEWLPVDPQNPYITAPDGSADDRFGSAVAMDYPYLVVGAPGVSSDQGAAYIYEWDGAAWLHKKTLTAADGVADDEFGFSVSISGNRVAVGAPGADFYSGAAYVFGGSGDDWVPLVGAAGRVPTGAIADLSNATFGHAVSISGDYLLVGAPFYADGGANGGAWIFYKDHNLVPDSWAKQFDLQDADMAGWAVHLSGDTAFVCHGEYNGEEGEVRTYTRSGVSWNDGFIIRSPSPTAGEKFGAALSGDADLLAVGGNKDVAYLFSRSGSNWSPVTTCSGEDTESGDLFGRAVALDTFFPDPANKQDEATFLFAGARDAGSSAEGAGYIFDGNAGWGQLSEHHALSPQADDSFGFAAALCGTLGAFGVPYDDEKGSNSGSVYVYRFREP